MTFNYPRHKVVIDSTSSGHDRLTCESCDKTLVRQPYMRDRTWAMSVTVFLTTHPMDEFDKLP